MFIIMNEDTKEHITNSKHEIQGYAKLGLKELSLTGGTSKHFSLVV